MTKFALHRRRQPLGLKRLRKQLDDLKTEQRRPTEAGETAKTVVAIAELQLQRADHAATKAEDRAARLEAELRVLNEKITGGEKMVV